MATDERASSHFVLSELISSGVRPDGNSFRIFALAGTLLESASLSLQLPLSGGPALGSQLSSLDATGGFGFDADLL